MIFGLFPFFSAPASASAAAATVTAAAEATGTVLLKLMLLKLLLLLLYNICTLSQGAGFRTRDFATADRCFHSHLLVYWPDPPQPLE